MWCASADRKCAEWGREKQCRYKGGECLTYTLHKKCGKIGDCVKRLTKDRVKKTCDEWRIIHYKDVHNRDCLIVDDDTKKCVKWSKAKPRKKKVCARKKIVTWKKGKCLERAFECHYMNGPCKKHSKKTKVCHTVKKCKSFKNQSKAPDCRAKCAYRKTIGLRCQKQTFPKGYKHPKLEPGSKQMKCYNRYRACVIAGATEIECLQKATKLKVCRPERNKLEKKFRLAKGCLKWKGICQADHVGPTERQYYCEKARSRMCMDYNRRMIERYARENRQKVDETDYTHVEYRDIPNKYSHLTSPCADALVHCHGMQGDKRAACLIKAKNICEVELQAHKQCALWRNDCAVKADGYGWKKACKKARSVHCTKYNIDPKWFKFDPKAEPSTLPVKPKTHKVEASLFDLEKPRKAPKMSKNGSDLLSNTAGDKSKSKSKSSKSVKKKPKGKLSKSKKSGKK